MYEIERTADRIVIRRGNDVVYSAPSNSFVVYRITTGLKVEKVRNLSDEDLLMALATAVEILPSPKPQS